MKYMPQKVRFIVAVLSLVVNYFYCETPITKVCFVYYTSDGRDASIVAQRKQVDIINSSLHKYNTISKLKMETQP